MVAEQLFRRALAIEERVLGPDDNRTLNTLAALIELLVNTKNNTEAELLGHRLLSRLEPKLPTQTPALLIQLNNYAAVLFANGKLVEAEEILRRVVKAREDATGPTREGLLMT